jgi:hypothetical protein
MGDAGIHILWPFGQFPDNLVFFMALWYTYFVVISYIFPVLVYCTTKNLATLDQILRIFAYWAIVNFGQFFEN